MLPRRRPSSTPSRSPSDDLSHVGRADAPKKVRICRVTERLPRLARLPHVKTQMPRTPKTPRNAKNAKSSTTTAENKRVGWRWSPPGGLQLNFRRTNFRIKYVSTETILDRFFFERKHFRLTTKSTEKFSTKNIFSPTFFRPETKTSRPNLFSVETKNRSKTFFERKCFRSKISPSVSPKAEAM